MRYTIGRLMQGAALLLLPLAIFWETTGALGRDNFGVADMLVIMVAGVVLFTAGWLMQGSPPKA
ncbi:MAG: hypothetical protein WEA31_06640 [Pirellulales bacterium]